MPIKSIIIDYNDFFRGVIQESYNFVRSYLIFCLVQLLRITLHKLLYFIIKCIQFFVSTFLNSSQFNTSFYCFFFIFYHSPPSLPPPSILPPPPSLLPTRSLLPPPNISPPPPPPPPPSLLREKNCSEYLLFRANVVETIKIVVVWLKVFFLNCARVFFQSLRGS